MGAKERVLDAVLTAGRPISVEEIAVQASISVDVVVRLVAELLQQEDSPIKVHTDAAIEELELQPA